MYGSVLASSIEYKIEALRLCCMDIVYRNDGIFINHFTDVPIPREINISAGAGTIGYNPLQLPYFTSSENVDINVVNINTMEEVD